ncbi:hypothetical protein ME793_08430 [Lactobacillus delbrueckii]|nr:hypothetical protein ME786_04620 [Lactobacillus delbrueckii]GHN26245.1 hypothetical protein ME787_09600 [Lactobacillus delbrueckii]GHN28098.1 hypothetical protein ME788_09100 [Lactobacillus delbrueckii]GHN30656.1 hypothetical protein ME789_16410 [Lactobacillus delbrueckii]GHN37613.1 hypothetical protein ME793_08430 [Lactobacillus delbrueckii]
MALDLLNEHDRVDEQNMIKRKTKPKSEFPTEESLDNFLGVQAIGYNDRNANRTHKGFGQVTGTLESYFD